MRKRASLLARRDDLWKAILKKYPVFIRLVLVAPLMVVMIAQSCLELLRLVGNDAIIYCDATFNIAWPGYKLLGFYLMHHGVGKYQDMQQKYINFIMDSFD